MDIGTYIIFLVLHLATVGLGLVAVILWKKDKISVKHIIPTVLFAIIDIAMISTMMSFSLPFLSTILVLALGNNFRSDDWPTEPKFATYYKIYILLISIFLISSFSVMTLVIGRFLSINSGSTDYMASVFSIMMPIILAGLLFAFSDPTNRYGNREPDRVIASGFAFLGSILALVFAFTLVADEALAVTFSIIFTIIALVPVVLIFISIFLEQKQE